MLTADIAALPKIMTSKVKKGATIHFKDGAVGELMDNTSGIARCVKIKTIGFPGTYDIGSMYVFDWKWVETPEGAFQVELTPAQKQKAALIGKILG